MKLRVFAATLACLVVTLAAPAGAQTPTQSAQSAPADLAFIRLIPKDAVAFVAARDAAAACAKADAFLASVFPKSVVEGLVGDSGLLGHIKREKDLDPQFTAKGGVAIVMLDPRKYAPAWAKKFNPDKPEVPKASLPYGIILPGKDVTQIIQVARAKKDGKYTQLVDADANEVCWCMETPGGIVLAPNRKIIGGFGGEGSSADVLSKAQQDMVCENDLLLWTDLKTLGDLRWTLFGEYIDENVGVFANLRGMVDYVLTPIRWALASKREMSFDARYLAVGGRLDAAGLLLETRLCYPPDSATSKVLKLLGGTRLGNSVGLRLLNLKVPYVVAWTMRGAALAPPELRRRAVDNYFRGEDFEDLEKADRTKVVDNILALEDQLGQSQWYVGGASDKGSSIGVAGVVKVKSSKEFVKLLKQSAGLLPKVLECFYDPSDIKVRYEEALERVGDLKADAINMDLPFMQGEEGERKALQKILNDTRLRVLILPLNEHTVVLTMCGGKEFLARVVAAAKDDKPVVDDALDTAMKRLPPGAADDGLASVSIANAYALVQRLSGGAEDGTPKALKSRAPLVAGLGVSAGDLRMVVHLPAKPIGEILRIILDEKEEPSAAP